MLNPVGGDVLVVGAGFAGAILAERFAGQLGRRVVLLERRKHLAGNMYDRYDAAGILIHQYGPHIFRTDDEAVWRYLSQFTAWRDYHHRVRASVDGRLVPMPFNLTSLEVLFLKEQAASLAAKLVARYGEGGNVPISELRKSEDAELASLGDFVFRKIYLNYTVKQWGERPEDLDFETITRRVPVRISREDGYFQQRHQAMPAEGYTRLFERMLAHPSIELRLGVDATRVLSLAPDGRIHFEGRPFDGLVVYSGAADELFGYCHGELPYRSLDFKVRTLDEDAFQPVAVVTYPGTAPYTRITEYKHMTGQKVAGATTIAVEYSLAYDRSAAGREPYYPIPKPANDALYARYKAEAARYPNLYLVGRLAEYRYYDMNDIIVRALAAFEELRARPLP
jgi:UDP-galactopyranose mutase